MAVPKPSGINVIIVGTGFSGLTAAIECHRKGHHVTVLESFPELKTLGDIISFGQNSAKIFNRWPGVPEQLENITLRPEGMELRTWKGDTLLKQMWAEEKKKWGIRYDGHRGEFHRITFEHAKSLGIDIKLGRKVTEYFESDTEAGVKCENGERYTADVVLAGDGVRSTGRLSVLGYEDHPKPSGYAVYRAWFDGSAIAKDPLLSFFFEQSSDQHIAYLGPDIHFIAASLKRSGSFSWVLTHKDDADIKESWQLEAPVSEAMKVIEDWAPIPKRIVELTPEPLIDWKLVYRDPLPTWISPKRRIALIGDAAHPFLPTSIQGASQAMEDGVVMAVCLARAGKSNVPEAVAAFEALRYNRVLGAQRTGVTTRDRWHQIDLEKARADPESMKLPREEWILNYDAEVYAEKHFDETMQVLRRTGIQDISEARKMHTPKAVRHLLNDNGLAKL